MPSLYRIYFSRDSTVLSLPINPEKLPETKESDNGEYNVLGLGPVMQPRTPKLRKVTISGLSRTQAPMDERGRVFTAIGVHYVFQERNGSEKAHRLYAGALL